MPLDRALPSQVDYTVPTDVAAFKSQFAIPEVCNKPNVPKCDGQVSAKSLAFLRAGSLHAPPPMVERSAA